MELLEVKALLKTMLLPPGAPLLVAILGLIVARRPALRSLGLMLCAFGVVALWLLATPIVAGQLMKIGREYPALDLREPIQAEAVVILAGGTRRYAPEYNEDAPNEVTLQRLVYGARVARVTQLPVLVTGGRGEAAVMNRFLIADLGVEPRWVEESARNTHENAAFSAQILSKEGIESIVLVTSALHMSRAAAEFRTQGIRVIAAPVSHYAQPEGLISRWIPGISGLRDSRNVMYEFLARLAYRLRADDESLEQET